MCENKEKTVHLFTARTGDEERLECGLYLGVISVNGAPRHVVQHSGGVTVLYDEDKWAYRELLARELRCVEINEEDILGGIGSGIHNW